MRGLFSYHRSRNPFGDSRVRMAGAEGSNAGIGMLDTSGVGVAEGVTDPPLVAFARSAAGAIGGIRVVTVEGHTVPGLAAWAPSACDRARGCAPPRESRRPVGASATSRTAVGSKRR